MKIMFKKVIYKNGNKNNLNCENKMKERNLCIDGYGSLITHRGTIASN